MNKKWQALCLCCTLVGQFLSAFLTCNVYAEIQPLKIASTQPEGYSPQQLIDSTLNAEQMIQDKNQPITQQSDYSPPEIYALQGQDPGYQLFFNSDGTIRQVDYTEPSSGRVYQRDVYYSNTGFYTQIGDYLNNGSVQKREYYSANGTKMREFYFNVDGSLEKMVFFDESTGVKFSEEWYHSQAVPKQRTLFNESGLRIRQVTFYDGSEVPESESSFDSVTGKITETRWVRSDGTLDKIDTYDASERVTRRRIFDAQGLVAEDQAYQYVSIDTGVWTQISVTDSQGRRIRSEQWDPNGRMLSQDFFNLQTDKLTQRKWFYATTPAAQTYRILDYDAQGNAQFLTEYDRNGALVSDRVNVSYLDDASSVLNSMIALQNSTPSGLLPDNPDDTTFIYHNNIQAEWAKIYAYTQASTYEQAVIGIDFLKQGYVTGAKKIFDFFFGEWHAEIDGGASFTGFYSMYNVDPVYSWKKYEWRKTLGENAWIGLFLLHYADAVAVSDSAERDKALALATAIGKWALSLPHWRGAPAMGAIGTDFTFIFSVENEIDHYALMKQLALSAVTAQDRQIFAQEASQVKDWLKTVAYDPAGGLFRSGGNVDYGGDSIQWDGVNSLDVNSWALSAIGPQALRDDFGIDIDAFASRIGQQFAVQKNGDFNGNLYESKGFDFSNAHNAQVVARQGMKWVEGTEQMILAYKILASLYRLSDPGKAAYYQHLADYFYTLNTNNATVNADGSVTYAYCDAQGVQIYSYSTLWKTPYGQRDPGSTAWTYLAASETNPFFF